MAKKRHTAEQVHVGAKPAAVKSFSGMQLSPLAPDLFLNRISR